MSTVGTQTSVERSPHRVVGCRVGIDENGLGASLGPLIVTAVVAEVEKRGARAIDDWHSDETHGMVLGDSKKLVRHGDVRLGEAWARVLVNEAARQPQHLLELISNLPVEHLQSRCPKKAHKQCWNDSHDAFLAEEPLLVLVRDELKALGKVGIKPIRVRSRIVCTDELNARFQKGENRFLVDLHSMEELIEGILERTNHPIGVVCGKVGSMFDYTRYLQRLGAKEPKIVSESKDVSHYHLDGYGFVKFVKDADATDPLVMLASLVGKYLRELFVSRIGGHFLRRVPDLRKPSGYHDPVTGEFVRATAEYRLKTAFPTSCFARIGGRDT